LTQKDLEFIHAKIKPKRIFVFDDKLHALFSEKVVNAVNNLIQNKQQMEKEGVSKQRQRSPTTSAPKTARQHTGKTKDDERKAPTVKVSTAKVDDVSKPEILLQEKEKERVQRKLAEAQEKEKEIIAEDASKFEIKTDGIVQRSRHDEVVKSEEGLGPNPEGQ
jgi:hypothetical protein